MTEKTDAAIKIVDKIIDNIETNPYSITNLRLYYSLVKLLEKNDEIKWIFSELYGYKNVENVPNYRKFRDRRNKNKIVLIHNDYAKIRAYAKNDERRKYYYNNYTITVGLYDFFYILNMVDNEIFRKSIDILSELKFSKMEFDIFEETRNKVDMILIQKCPKIFTELTETYNKLNESESSLELRQIAYSCRVVLENFADIVYPHSVEDVIGFDNKSHSVKKNAYINRIIQFVYESIDSDSDKDFIEDHLNYLADYLKRINELVNVGTHSEKSRDHANRCVIYTYLILGDIINLSKFNFEDY